MIGRYAGELDGPEDKRLFAGNGGGPRRIVDVSHYSDPISHGEGEASGRSRNAGDATPDVQTQAMKAIVSAGRARGLSSDEIALALATARLESGFNPDAAAGGSSGVGLGQITDPTARGLGLAPQDRWKLPQQAEALVRLQQSNMERARSQGHLGDQLDRYTYAYHHDGPTLSHHGLGLADRDVLPYVDLYRRYVKSVGDEK